MTRDTPHDIWTDHPTTGKVVNTPTAERPRHRQENPMRHLARRIASALCPCGGEHQ